MAGALADAYRENWRRAESVIHDRGVASVSCPHCGAPLRTDGHSTTAVCTHCRAPSLISSKLWFRLGLREPRIEPIWVLLRGRSPRRRLLEDKAANVDPFELELQARARAALASKGAASNPIALPGAAPPAPPAPAWPAASPGYPAAPPPAIYPPLAPTASRAGGSSRALIVVVVIVVAAILLAVALFASGVVAIDL
jgi:hypothetical protein